MKMLEVYIFINEQILTDFKHLIDFLNFQDLGTNDKRIRLSY